MSFYIKLIKFIDKFVVSLVCLLIGVFVRTVHIIFRFRPPKTIRNILFIKVWAIGDTINFLPTVDSIKKRFPKAKIWALVKNRNKSVFQATSVVDRMIIFEKGNYIKTLSYLRKFDLVIDGEPYLGISALLAFYLGRFRLGFGRQIRSLLYHWTVPFDRKKHIVLGYLDFAKMLGGKIDYKCLIRLDNIPEKERIAITSFMKKNRLLKKDLVGFFMGAAESATVSRMWSKEKFAKLADLILASDKKIRIVLPAARSDEAFIKKVRGMIKDKDRVYPAIGNLFETYLLISRCDIFISNDTGPMHIAAAQGTKTIGLFGPNTPVLWGPFGSSNISIYKPGVDCSPCIRNDKGYMPDCRDAKCIKRISVKDVYFAFKRLYNNSS